MNAPHPHIETDWRAVAMFLAGFITEENPSYTLLIFSGHCGMLEEHHSRRTGSGRKDLK